MPPLSDAVGLSLYGIRIVEGDGLGRVFRKPKAKRVFAGERISGLGRGQA